MSIMIRTIPNITPLDLSQEPVTTNIVLATATVNAPTTPILDYFCHVFSSFLRKPSAILAIPLNKNANVANITKVAVDPLGNVMNKIVYRG